MNFILTDHIYPLESKVILSKFFNLTFDNPRTSEEIEYIERLIKTSLTSKLNGLRLPEEKSDEPILTFEHFITDFNEAVCPKTAYGKSFMKSFKPKKPYNYIARMWVVCRYNDEGENDRMREEHKKMVQEGQRGFFMLDDDSIVVQQERILESYCSIISLLLRDSSDYFGGNFLLDEAPHDIRDTTISRKLNMRIMMWGFGCSREKTKIKNKTEWDDWFYTVKYERRLLKIVELIEKSLNVENKEKIIYLGSLLLNASNVSDNKYTLVVLVGILELLLTHDPDFSRFNVEDSIKKQFVLKTSTLVYLYNNKIDLESTKKRLKTIYDQRSNIAHGNFNEHTKYLKALNKKEGKEEHFDDLISDMYQYVRAVITMYFRDTKFVDHLKAG